MKRPFRFLFLLVYFISPAGEFPSIPTKTALVLGLNYATVHAISCKKHCALLFCFDSLDSLDVRTIIFYNYLTKESFN